MKRTIIQINEELCNGCGLCAQACHEGAIEMVNGKAHLISDTYCDGLGACLPNCPTNAITMLEREAAAYDETAVQKHLENKSAGQKTPSFTPLPVDHSHGHTCPGSAARNLRPTVVHPVQTQTAPTPSFVSELKQWPVQIKLVNPHAPYFENADLLVAADCTAYAYANFHAEFIRGRITLIGCPKLDDNQYYTEKLTEILGSNSIRSITVVRMEVPCCSGIVGAVKRAMLNSGKIVPYNEIVIGIDGSAERSL